MLRIGDFQEGTNRDKARLGKGGVAGGPRRAEGEANRSGSEAQKEHRSHRDLSWGSGLAWPAQFRLCVSFQAGGPWSMDTVRVNASSVVGMNSPGVHWVRVPRSRQEFLSKWVSKTWLPRKSGGAGGPHREGEGGGEEDKLAMHQLFTAV